MCVCVLVCCHGLGKMLARLHLDSGFVLLNVIFSNGTGALCRPFSVFRESGYYTPRILLEILQIDVHGTEYHQSVPFEQFAAGL